MYPQPPADFSADKPPLTHLQELTSVFPSPENVPATSLPRRQTHSVSNAEPSYVPDHFPDRECDSGYAADHPRLHEREPDAGYASDRPNCETECEGPRECFGQRIAKEEPDALSELCGDSDSGCGKWDDEPPSSVLPGFQQAFGSTEIGRFSRNDFFTNPSPPQVLTQPEEPMRKTTRKPRTVRAKQPRKERPESPKPRAPATVPTPEAPCCAGAYEACSPRYCSDYGPNYPQPYPSPYPSPAYPLRSFPFPLPCGQSWSEPRWQNYHPPYQPAYHQPPYHQPPQWTSANMYPLMRLDY